MQRVEIGDAIDAQDDRLAVDRKLLDAVLQGGLGNPWIALRPIIAAARDQPHPIAITLNADAKAVMLDFVKPLWPGRDVGCISRRSGFCEGSQAQPRRRGEGEAALDHSWWQEICDPPPKLRRMAMVPARNGPERPRRRAPGPPLPPRSVVLGTNSRLRIFRLDVSAGRRVFRRTKSAREDATKTDCRVVDSHGRGLDDRLVSCTGLDRLPADQPHVLEKTLLACSLERTIESSSVSPQARRPEKIIKLKYSQGEKP
jgi:hypothetical protein